VRRDGAGGERVSHPYDDVDLRQLFDRGLDRRLVGRIRQSQTGGSGGHDPGARALGGGLREAFVEQLQRFHGLAAGNLEGIGGLLRQRGGGGSHRHQQRQPERGDGFTAAVRQASQPIQDGGHASSPR